MFPIIQGQTPLHYAAKNGHGTCCSILLSAGCTVDCIDNDVMDNKYLLFENEPKQNYSAMQ